MEQNSYRQIMKATSIFGGVQVFNIIISIIRSKIIALLLGPMGMGVLGLLTSTISFINQLTNLGLNTSAIKDLASAYSTGNETKLAVKVKVFRRVILITGIIGSLLTILLSPWLSELTFGNRDYTIAFIWISISIITLQLSSANFSIMQGLRKLKDLAKANVIGSLFGLIISIPLYYYLQLNGIVPALIISAILTFFVSVYYSKKTKLPKVIVSGPRVFLESKAMITMGFLISISGLITIGSSHIVRLYISNQSGIDQVGLYNAGFAIINTYVGIIFTAMATDYFPRLSAISSNNKLCRITINQQAEIAILILAPLIATFIIFVNWGIILLYSSQFVAINDMVIWAALGMFFKAISWSIGFLFLAKGASKLFFYNELIANVYILIFNICGYHFYGLTGLGLSFLIGYIIVFIQYFFIVKIKYEFSIDKNLIQLFSIQFTIASVCILTIKMVEAPYSYFIGLILIIGSSTYSLIQLNKLIDLKELYNKFIIRK